MFELIAGAAVIVVCLICEAFFSGTETAMVSLDRSQVKARAQQGSRSAAMIQAVLETPERFFSTTLLGTNMVAVLSNAVATVMVISLLGVRYQYLTILIMSPLILLFGEVVPKTVFRYHAVTVTHYIIYPFRVISALFFPFVVVLSGVTRLFIRTFGLDRSQLNPYTTREDLENYLSMWHINGRLKSAEKKMVERIFDFAETCARDIMVPLINISAVEQSEGIDTAIEAVQSGGHSRIPVYDDEAYNIVGIVHAFDVLVASQQAVTLRDIMRPASYVPDSMPVVELLKQMRTGGISMAVVVNEYGGTTGIVTLEDILEEVVGEIYDEYDVEEHMLVKLDKNKYMVNGRMEIDELNDKLHLDLPKDNYETVAGFLLKHIERIPAIGESYQAGPVRFFIKLADRRSIKQVVITIAEAAEDHQHVNGRSGS